MAVSMSASWEERPPCKVCLTLDKSDISNAVMNKKIYAGLKNWSERIALTLAE